MQGTDEHPPQRIPVRNRRRRRRGVARPASVGGQHGVDGDAEAVGLGPER